jgi:hypothetical protein
VILIDDCVGAVLGGGCVKKGLSGFGAALFWTDIRFIKL